MIRARAIRRLAVPAFLLAVVALVPRAARAAAAPGATQVTLADARLLDQDGAPVRFRTEAIGDRIVVIDFVYTTCPTVCPLLSAIFARLQERLGDRLERGVRLVSVSLDPANDTPERIKAYAARHRAGPHWTWLTGSQDDVERVLKGLGAWTPNFTAHAPMVLVGDGRTGTFTRLNGFPDVDRIVTRVDELLAARSATASAQERTTR